jgi:hypothetical protein
MDRPQPGRLEGMVLVASGAAIAIRQWSTLFREASIPFAVVRCHYDDTSAPIDHAQIWVEDCDAERARMIFRSADGEEKQLLE